MNILHVIPSIDIRYGGPSYAVQAMVAYQNKNGVRADILTTHKLEITRCELPATSDSKAGDIKYKKHIYSFPSYLGEYKFSIGLVRWLQRNIKHYDVLHIHSIFCFSTILAASLARKAGIPFVVRPLGQLYPWALRNRHWFLKKVYLALIENRTINHANTLQFTTQDELDRCEIRIDRSKTCVLPLGIEQPHDMPKATALTIYPEFRHKKILLYLSRIHPIKGLTLALPWLAPILLKRPDWVFVVAGEAENAAYFESLKLLVQQCGIKHQVVFTGKVSGDNKAALYALADLFLLPSHSENFGIAVVEAMAAGVPVLISDQIGLHDEIIKKQAGLVFRLEREAFIKVTTKLVDDEHARKTSSDNAKKLTLESFDWQVITKQQINLYQKMVDKGA